MNDDANEGEGCLLQGCMLHASCFMLHDDASCFMMMMVMVTMIKLMVMMMMKMQVKDVYYKEMAELLKKATGAEHVEMFHHQVLLVMVMVIKKSEKTKNNNDGFDKNHDDNS